MITGSPTLHMRLPSLCMQALGLGYSTVWANRAGSQSTDKIRRKRLSSGRDGFPSERDIVPTPLHNASMFGIIQGRGFIAPLETCVVRRAKAAPYGVIGGPSVRRQHHFSDYL